MTALPRRTANLKNACVVAFSANPPCDTSYICKNLGAGPGQWKIGSALHVFAAIEIVAPAKFTSLVGVLERLCTQRDKRLGVRSRPSFSKPKCSSARNRPRV